MNSIWLKRAGLAAALLAVIGGFAYALREKPVQVDVIEAVKAPMQIAILQEGVTRVRDVYTVSAPISGHLARTVLEEGSIVKANETVVASIHPLDPPLIDTRTIAELTAAREGARASLSIAEQERKKTQMDLLQAENDLERAERLAARGIVSETALQKAQTAVDLLKSQVDVTLAAIELRKAELASTEARLEQPSTQKTETSNEECCVRVTAPIDGVVLAVYAKSEQPVSVGAKIADIGDPSELEIVADLLSSDAVRVKPGTPAEIIQWGGDINLRARVKRIDPAAFTKVSALGIEEQRVNAVLELLDTDPRLGHGFRVHARIPIWESPSSLQVPISALFRTGNRWNVFSIVDGHAKVVEVKIRQMNDDATEVLEGLNEGDLVVVHPSDTLADGSLIEIRNP